MVFVFGGIEPVHQTYVITVYAPCVNIGIEEYTVYKQRKRYIQEKDLKTNPKTMFREDFLAVLQRWRAKGDRVVLFMDANEHVMDGAMCEQLTGGDPQMREVVHSETKAQDQNPSMEYEYPWK